MFIEKPPHLEAQAETGVIGDGSVPQFLNEFLSLSLREPQFLSSFTSWSTLHVTDARHWTSSSKSSLDDLTAFQLTETAASRVPSMTWLLPANSQSWNIYVQQESKARKSRLSFLMERVLNDWDSQNEFRFRGPQFTTITTWQLISVWDNIGFVVLVPPKIH